MAPFVFSPLCTPVSASRLCAAVVLVVALLHPAPLRAQAQDEGHELAPPHLSLVEGDVRLERAGEVVQAEIGHILAVGDRLRSERGRLEVVFGDGSALHVDEHTTLDLLDDWLLRLIDGRVFLHVATPPDDLPVIAYRIDTPAVAMRAAMPGEYRVSASERPQPLTDVAVARGLAEVISERGSVALHAGERVTTRAGQGPGRVSFYNAAAWDAFDRWSYDRRRAWTDGAHAAHLPRQLTPYASTLARHGTWSHHPTYGSVWYPHVVTDWRPFYHGRWTVLSPYGWTWVGADPWVWPTHYYGSWSIVGGRWFWIPGRVWAPARVHWVVAPGYIGWLPFGPVGVVHHVGWTILPRNVFHINVIVPRHAVNVYSLRPEVRRTFVAQRPPEPRGVAVPRASVIAANRVQPPSSRTAVARDEATAPTGAAITTRAAGARTADTGDASGSRTAVGGRGTESGAASRSGVARVPPATAPETSQGADRSDTARGAITRVPPQGDAAATAGGAGADRSAAFPRRAPATPGTAVAAPGSTRQAPGTRGETPATAAPAQGAGTSAAPAQAPARLRDQAPPVTRATPRGAPRQAPPPASSTPAPAAEPAGAGPPTGGAPADTPRAVPRGEGTRPAPVRGASSSSFSRTPVMTPGGSGRLAPGGAVGMNPAPSAPAVRPQASGSTGVPAGTRVTGAARSSSGAPRVVPATPRGTSAVRSDAASRVSPAAPTAPASSAPVAQHAPRMAAPRAAAPRSTAPAAIAAPGVAAAPAPQAAPAARRAAPPQAPGASRSATAARER